MSTKRSFGKTVACFCAVVALSIVFDRTVYSDANRYTDTQLILIGDDALRKHDFPGALMFLFAYIQKNPPALANNPTFYASVQAGYERAREEVRQAVAQQQALAVAPKGSTTDGLSRPLPRITIPPDAK